MEMKYDEENKDKQMLKALAWLSGNNTVLV